jgi:hypothetical protein
VAIYIGCDLRTALPGERPGTLEAGFSALEPKFFVFHELLNQLATGTIVFSPDEIACGTRNFRQGRCTRQDYGCSACHGFENRESKPFIKRRENQKPGSGK